MSISVLLPLFGKDTVVGLEPIPMPSPQLAHSKDPSFTFENHTGGGGQVFSIFSTHESTKRKRGPFRSEALVTKGSLRTLLRVKSSMVSETVPKVSVRLLKWEGTPRFLVWLPSNH